MGLVNNKKAKINIVEKNQKLDIRSTLANILNTASPKSRKKYLSYAIMKHWKLSRFRIIIVVCILLIINILVPFYKMGYQQHIIDNTKYVVNMFNSILFALFGISVASFIFISNIIKPTMIVTLLEATLKRKQDFDKKEKEKKELNKKYKIKEFKEKYTRFESLLLFFIGVFIWSVIYIILNFVILMTLHDKPNSWELIWKFSNYNEIITSFFMNLYIFAILNYLFEYVSLLINIFETLIYIFVQSVVDEIDKFIQ